MPVGARRNTMSNMRIELLELPEPISSATSLKSPSFYKPRKAYKSPVPKARQASYLALLLLVGLAVYFFIFPSLWDSHGPSVRRVGEDILQVDLSEYRHIDFHRLHRHHHHHQHNHDSSSPSPSAGRSPRRLSREEKLAAITSFILSPLHSNALSGVSAEDVRVEDLLEFSLESQRADEMVKEMVQDIWNEEKVVVYGKRADRSTRALKTLLPSWDLPRATVIELDQRDDGAVLTHLLRQLTVADSPRRDEKYVDAEWMLPLLIVRGTPITGGLEHIKKMQENGELVSLLGSS